jgi:cytochrome c oxidase subunit 2
MPVLPPWISDPAGPTANEIVPLYWFMFGAAVIVLAIVDGALIWSGIKYRERPGVKAQQFHGNNFLELAWTVIPTIMVVTFTVLSFQQLLKINIDASTPADMTIKVHARQWTFGFEYPQSYKDARFVTRDNKTLQAAQELHIPVNTKVKLEITSQDVIHSFWIPNLGGKKDAVPGRTTYLSLEASRAGTFKGQCFEFCGEGHADMLLIVVAHPQSEYAAWAKDAVAAADLLLDPATAAGREKFLSLACAGCHTVAGTAASGKVGPELTHIAKDPNHKIAGIFSPVNAENLHRWIKDPQKEKPGTVMPTLGLDDATIDDIVKWLLTLK